MPTLAFALKMGVGAIPKRFSIFTYLCIIAIFHIDMRSLKITCLFSITLIICFSCGQNNNEIKENTTRRYKCYPSISSGEIRLYSGNEYEPPSFFKEHLDTLIKCGENSLCYRKGYTGFIVDFASISKGIGEITIYIEYDVSIRNYTKGKGYFKYKSHYFVCFGDVENYPIIPVRQVEVKIAFPKKTISEIDDTELNWSYLYNQGELYLKR